MLAIGDGVPEDGDGGGVCGRFVGGGGEEAVVEVV